MSWSPAAPDDVAVSAPSEQRCCIVEDGIDSGCPATIVKLAAAKHGVGRVFKSVHSKRLPRNPAAGVLGGLVVVVTATQCRVVAILAPTVLTIHCEEPKQIRVVAVRDTLVTIRPRGRIQKVVAREARASCSLFYDIEKTITMGASDRLTLWARPITDKLFVGFYQSNRTLQLACIGCGTSFSSVEEWERHSKQSSRGVLKGDAKTRRLVSAWLTCDAQPLWNGQFVLRPTDLAKHLQRKCHMRRS